MTAGEDDDEGKDNKSEDKGDDGMDDRRGRQQ